MSSESNNSTDPKAELIKNITSCPSSGQAAPDYTHEMITSDGQKVTIRPITCKDKYQLQDFHTRLSTESLYLRYQYSRGALTENELQAFCNVDYDNTLGLVAEIQNNGQTQIVGVGRYARLNDPSFAEMAFIVQDSEQKNGIGTQLLRHLAILAWDRGVRVFVGELLKQNGRMINILRKSDPKMNQLTDGTSCTITIKVDDARNNTPPNWNTCSIDPGKNSGAR